ncbi:LytTR family transcriptional regulator DNA-binding domain-containing protein [Solitalea sp. MAHUQ-68]|uniref:LytTR family transcriptional regulator DNA-binding domain-containing protein n=1 Tax=Solitalea agri TaxID=2953739 RepID=A0A9X2F1J8_9SPHI|nr:LytTR family transcriptional regulator DNA-binding domain-containing protein [Solitalea agri]MCO4292982.1 LytTR family transcriptional regulator DNA-binding domain-containing protein [Solitalea agri]
MPRFNTIIIDDEPLARNRLKRLLGSHEQFFSIEAEAANGEEGRQLIEELRPDLIFLDIEMPLLNGFEMLSKLSFIPLVVFTTAFDQYAIKAFEENSIDYLLKPIEPERLELTVAKLQKVNEQKDTAHTENLLTIIEKLQPKKELKALPVKIGDKFLLIKTSEISHIEADEKYVSLKTLSGNSYLTDYTLSTLENKLPECFLRVHRGCIINTENMKEVRKGFNGALIAVMNDSNGTKISTSRSYTDNLKRILDI